ncbi:cytochrome P450 [Musa troglodytarum]|uniref:Cytochrome P450 n=2 Tax=Musa troglodytarum TaxID=320322 RepID=A0A9E7KGZ3_9LILI|nr:cytochrome P450 [Musa troglodytarum]
MSPRHRSRPLATSSSPPRSRLLLVISSPATVEECLATHNLSFLNRPLLFSGKHLHYDGTSFVVAPYGLAGATFAPSPPFSYCPRPACPGLHIRAANVRSLLRGLFLHSCSEECGFVPVSMRPSFTELMLNTLLEMIVGKKCYGGSAATEGLDEEGKGFASVIKEAFRLSSAASPEDFLPFLKWIGVNGLEKQLIRLGKEIDVLLQGMVDERREGTRTERNDAKKTLVDDMLSLQEEDPQYYTDNIIKGMISLSLLWMKRIIYRSASILIFAGFDTSSVTMEWAMSLLLNHPEALKMVHDEIETHVGHQRLVIDSDLPQLRYLNNVIRETLRLLPPGPLLVPRESTMDCSAGGFHVPRGAMLMVNAYKMHRDPALWTDPAEFKPERFESGEGEGYEYVPFGVGRRRCPGEAMAMKAVGLVLASLVQCFEWKRLGEEEVDLSEGEGLSMPKAIPLEVLCKPRQAMMDILPLL